MTLRRKLKKHFPRIFGLLSKIKQTCLNALIRAQKRKLAARIEQYYGNDPEAQEVISFLRAFPTEMIPYSYTREYSNTKIAVTMDLDEGLHVTQVNGNNIYFPREMSSEYIEESVRVALMEQDERSPHKYLPVESISVKGDVAVLCGASDGIYALHVIDNFRKLYLFEANAIWHHPLRMTLKNHLHKIEIAPYYISDTNGPRSVTLDSFFEGKTNESVNYIQADIEGHELKMLQGAKRLISASRDLKLCLCCYHTAHQEEELTEFLLHEGFSVQHSKGFLLMWMQYPLHAPYLRRGVLYATK